MHNILLLCAPTATKFNSTLSPITSVDDSDASTGGPPAPPAPPVPPTTPHTPASPADTNFFQLHGDNGNGYYLVLPRFSSGPAVSSEREPEPESGLRGSQASEVPSASPAESAPSDASDVLALQGAISRMALNTGGIRRTNRDLLHDFESATATGVIDFELDHMHTNMLGSSGGGEPPDTSGDGGAKAAGKRQH